MCWLVQSYAATTLAVRAHIIRHSIVAGDCAYDSYRDRDHDSCTTTAHNDSYTHLCVCLSSFQT
jgi:hypothetical protein